MLRSFRLFEILAKPNSGSIAKRRLKFLLVSDRAGCTPEILEMIKDDMIKSISKYMDIDTEGLEIRITKMGDRGAGGKLPVLYASIPIRTLYTKGTCL